MTPPPKHSTDPQEGNTAGPWVTEGRCFEIAAEVVERDQPGHMRFCETDKNGPVCILGGKLDGRIEAMDERLKTLELERSKEQGANQEIAKAAARSTMWRTVVISAAFSAVASLGLFALQRAFPAQAHAAQTGAKTP